MASGFLKVTKNRNVVKKIYWETHGMKNRREIVDGI